MNAAGRRYTFITFITFTTFTSGAPEGPNLLIEKALRCGQANRMLRGRDFAWVGLLCQYLSPVQLLVASRAQGDEIFLSIIALLAPEPRVVHLQT